jgi:transposase InsO family protein
LGCNWVHVSPHSVRTHQGRSWCIRTGGSQFRSHAYIRLLPDSGLTGSMGRAGACGDNAAVETFFALLHKNVLDRHRWETRDQLRLAIITWIERTYHRRCGQRRRTSPADRHCAQRRGAR